MNPRGQRNSEEVALRRRSVEIGGYYYRISHQIGDDPEALKVNPTPELTTFGGIKLGWVQGVLIPCLLNIWGVMLFLRISWIVAQAGIAYSVVIIFISGVVCVITTLSLSAICTNGELQGGGVYFLVSRSLGAELGASVGIIFAFANAVAASMNTIGFCDSLNELLKSKNMTIIDNGPNDTRIVGAIALFVMCIICAVGMDWETKTQNFLITIIVTAISNYILGAILGPTTDEELAQGFVGLSVDRAKANWLPDYRFSEGEFYGFFSVFAIYFPAVTGVQAGANICGDLKDPGTAIPKGTLIALGISITTYLVMASLSGAGALRDASGVVNDPAVDSCKPNCPYGLHNNYQIMHLMAFWSPLIYAGCWAATLSTALTNLLSVPRLIQALGLDRVYPGLIFFSKRYGKHGEPYRGYVLVFCVSVSFLLIADLNMIAPLITNFYLASYALINFCTFHAAFFKPISWRPRFRFFNTWLSLGGFVLCLAIMMVISWVMALLTTFIFITLYLLVLYRKPEASWGSSTEAQRYQETITSILNISHRTANIKSFNPQLLVLAGKPGSRPWLLDMGGLLTKVGSFMLVADIVTTKLTLAERQKRRLAAEEIYRKEKFRAFYILLQEFSYEQGILALLQAAGIGRIAPNVLLLGYKHNWTVSSHETLLTYYRMIRASFKFGMSVSILRVPSNMRLPDSLMVARGANLDTNSVGRDDEDSTSVVRGPGRGPAAGPSFVDTGEQPLSQESPHSRAVTVMNSDSDLEIDSPLRYVADDQMPESALNIHLSQSAASSTQSNKSRMSARQLNYKHFNFHSTSVLDVWWLFDDGGMNILLPYIIARRSGKEKMNMRVFALPRGNHRRTTEDEVAKLLKSFRIEYSELILIEGLSEKPSDNTWKFFHSTVINHRCSGDDELLLSDTEAMRLHGKTSRYLRLRELLIENSYGADLIVMSMPFTREGTSATMYMAWLDIMSHDMPPTLFVRGNSTVVIDG
ncbi:bumetanide-sensitive sodium-(potassium)-chloride cotransporter-like isoform X2 [Trichoplusia ni]|uniref:Bumetanide-sensitive sodium-(Potassium)-chloride cotransporter-like isoform X2 n=1 Tax=Trichoplusia ni TaxID=7111 RepID=A0A7E5WLC2_TRINI|nr:bumetanide-sensitive sodium-(potassium)-chloride cotransporter-like isoform X2 [Trichoplusia ni]